jgi:hypothetical protein
MLCSLLQGCGEKDQIAPRTEVEFYFSGDANGNPFQLTTSSPLVQPLQILTTPPVISYITQIGKMELYDSTGIQVRLDVGNILSEEEIRALQGKTFSSFYGFTQQFPQFFIKKSNGLTWDAVYESPDQNGSQITVDNVYTVPDFDKQLIRKPSEGYFAAYTTEEVFVVECTGDFKLKNQQLSQVRFNMLLYSMEKR